MSGRTNRFIDEYNGSKAHLHNIQMISLMEVFYLFTGYLTWLWDTKTQVIRFTFFAAYIFKCPNDPIGLFTIDILTYSGKNTGVSNDINDDSVQV